MVLRHFTFWNGLEICFIQSPNICSVAGLLGADHIMVVKVDIILKSPTPPPTRRICDERATINESALFPTPHYLRGHYSCINYLR